MAQGKKNEASGKKSGKNARFEERLSRLQTLSEEIKDPDMGLEDALALFEEGITLAKSLEEELNKIENKIQVMINQPRTPDEKPELDLFSSVQDE